jgi:hypothetical protein
VTDERLRIAAMATAAAVALAVVLPDWYALDDYTPDGWDATWWARAAALLALANLLLLRYGAVPARVAAAIAGAIVLLVAARVAFPPDFGLDFSGLTVPVERRPGCWAALALALTHLAATALPAFRAGAPGASAAAP